MRDVVVLPQPDSPTRPSVSPARISKDTSSTALTCPSVRASSTPLVTAKNLLRPSTRSSCARAHAGTALKQSAVWSGPTRTVPG
jgi:hypothetical protein